MKYIFVLFALILNVSADTKPMIVDLLPEELRGYSYVNFYNFNSDLGYSLRYAKKTEDKNYADIYIWPVSKEAKGYSHHDIVLITTKMALDDIYTMQQSGAYSNVVELSNETANVDGLIIARCKLSMLRENLKIVSYLYVTEHKGKLLKIRITLPDNEINRSREDIENFAIEMFINIMDNIDSA